MGIERGGMSRGLNTRAQARAASQVRNRENTDLLLRRVGEAAVQGANWLAELGWSGQYLIDEVAFLLPEGGEGDEWFDMMLNRVGEQGLTYFNRDEDNITTGPLPSQYEARYDFFSTNLGVRLELLRLRGGYSPLHHLYRVNSKRPREATIVHVSFKIPSVEEYQAACMILREREWEMGQRCTSTYGVFSYWNRLGGDGPQLWLKPRVNVRDQPKAEVLEAPEWEDEDEDEEEFYSPEELAP